MIRTQVYFSEQQHEALRQAAAREGVSMTEFLRRLVERYVLGHRPGLRFDKEAVLAFVGLGESGESAIAADHDEALGEALRAQAVR